jgi:pimeloyl-ACP methyl ester carboxylesterase
MVSSRAVSIRDVVTVLLPGTGSDDDYLRRALAGPLEDIGAHVIAVAPEPDRLVQSFLDAVDRAAQDAPTGRILVGGVSLGALLATRWALAHPDRTVAVLAVLPPWTGEPADAPAALSARHTAGLLRRDGLAVTTAAMRSSSPRWLADELARSWQRQWPALPDAMEEAAACVGPSQAELQRLGAPLAVVAATDDLVHPAGVAADWAAWAPHGALATVRLADFGPAPRLLGAACVEALRAVDG